ncbi:NADP-dependent alcohol dehydrogenase C 2 [Chlamydiales bacterium SCGC AG-110-P3]|nr:NADP-dependent alcohol dehydrogenase C 2 [Chlamydiales bacterium SCGC AG-110-P3]
MSTSIKAYSTPAADKPLVLSSIERRHPNSTDVTIDILFCGVCHSDIHTARNEWHNTVYPCIPGHEIVGVVTAVGSKVTKHKIGDKVAVGCIVDSCRTCSSCRVDLEQHCEEGATFTYNSEDKHLKSITYGGYSQAIVVDEAFVLRLPENLDLGPAAPLLCAGITTYSPLKRYGVTPGQRVGIVGLGGLGHMGVKFAVAMGAHVVLITHSKGKKEDAKRLGASEVLLSSDQAEMEAATNSLDFILDTVSANHDLNLYLSLLKRSGTMVLVGAPPDPAPVAAFNLIFQRRQLAGSLIGGLKETQEMLDFCGKHNIVCDVEMIKMEQINEAYDRMMKSDVKYRFVIDMQSIKD